MVIGKLWVNNCIFMNSMLNPYSHQSYSNTLLVTFNHRISLRRPLVRTRGSSEATDNTMNVRIENTIASNAARAGSTIPNPHTVSMYAAQEHSGEPYKADTFHDDLRESEDDTVLDINSVCAFWFLNKDRSLN